MIPNKNRKKAVSIVYPVPRIINFIYESPNLQRGAK
jgi:hypothetical protein